LDSRLRGNDVVPGPSGLSQCHWLLTLHNKPLPQLADTEDTESWLSERSTAGLVAAAMVAVSLAAVSRAEDLRSAVLAL